MNQNRIIWQTGTVCIRKLTKSGNGVGSLTAGGFIYNNIMVRSFEGWNPSDVIGNTFNVYLNKAHDSNLTELLPFDDNGNQIGLINLIWAKTNEEVNEERKCSREEASEYHCAESMIIRYLFNGRLNAKLSCCTNDSGCTSFVYAGNYMDHDRRLQLQQMIAEQKDLIRKTLDEYMSFREELI